MLAEGAVGWGAAHSAVGQLWSWGRRYLLVSSSCFFQQLQICSYVLSPCRVPLHPLCRSAAELMCAALLPTLQQLQDDFPFLLPALCYPFFRLFCAL